MQDFCGPRTLMVQSVLLDWLGVAKSKAFLPLISRVQPNMPDSKAFLPLISRVQPNVPDSRAFLPLISRVQPNMPDSEFRPVERKFLHQLIKLIM
ncbi:hypothetical protein AWJ19_20420 [Paenibacillus sp. DMB5]|nr:hypothetical protein AWJ19_20420 [Paenibacillus sp. DMB5]